MKIGIVFAGQGAQYEGMGKDLYDNYSKAREIFDEAGDQIKEWCFNSEKAVLRETHVTQPSVYTVTMAAYEVLIGEMEKIDEIKNNAEILAFAGFSLGEYAALTAAGAIDSIKACNEIVSKRGKLMQEAGLDGEGNSLGKMVAAFGKRDKILELVEQAKGSEILQVANFNSPIQSVVAGTNEAIDKFLEICKANKLKAVPLSVGTAFHTEMMESASIGLLPLLKQAKMKKPEIVCYSNITGKDIMSDFSGEDISEYLAQNMADQIRKPVYWEEIVKELIRKEVEIIIEVGPGKTLSAFTRKIDNSILTTNVENKETLEETLKLLKEYGGKKC